MTERPLLDRERNIVEKYFPSPSVTWEKLRGGGPAKIPKDEEYAYFAYVCIQDFADRYQFAGRSFFSALNEWFLQLRLKINSDQTIAATFYFRYYFDYGVLCLFSALNHLISSMNYWHGKLNIPEKKTMTIGQILKKHQKISPLLVEYARSLANDKKYKYIVNYRNDWSHQGIPKLYGEIRPRRINPIETHNFLNRLLGLVKLKNGSIGGVRWEDKPDFRIHRLVYCASWLYKKIATAAIDHASAVANNLQFSVSWDEVKGDTEGNKVQI